MLREPESGVRRHDRRHVLWLGSQVPSPLTYVCNSMGLETEAVSAEALVATAPRARALFLELPADNLNVDWHRLIVGEALSQGLAVSLMMKGPDSGPPVMPDKALVDQYFAQVNSFERDLTRVQAHFREWMRAVAWSLNHDPGPPENPRLQLLGDVPAVSESNLLVRRAFGDFAEVRLELIRGGLSGATVLRVYPVGSRRCFIAKVQDLQKSREERSNALLLRESLPFRRHAPPLLDRCAEGECLGVMVYDFVEGATAFLAAVRGRPVVLVTSLFEETLVDCRAAGVRVSRPLGTVLDQAPPRVLRWTDALKAAAVRASTTMGDSTTDDDLRASLLGLPATEYMEGPVHGDLQWANLFVAGSASEVILIDCARASSRAPLVIDPACLEVALTFPVNHGILEPVQWPTGSERTAWLRQSYTFPLGHPNLPDLPGGAGWLSLAIRAIRERALGAEPNPVAYSVAVAAHLLRFASYDGNADLDERALAFSLAVGIVHGATCYLERV